MDALRDWIRAAEAARVTCLNPAEFVVLIQHQKRRLEKALSRAVSTMRKDVKTRGLEFAKFLSGLPLEERARRNELSRKEALEQHKAFRENFKMFQIMGC